MNSRELTLEDIQNKSLGLLSIIDEFCQTNDIDYSLGYGALIGAVRHKGFIPWDDDIDIILTRPNYDKLVSLFNNDALVVNKGLKLFAPELGNSYYNISHICDMRDTRVRKYYQWTDENTGIWIDVFPIDALPDDKGELLRKQSKRCFDVCGSCVPFSREFSFDRHLKIIGKKVIYGWHNRRKEIRKYLNLIDLLPSYGTTEYVCNIGSPYGSKDIHRKELFDDYIRSPFSDITVSIIKGYHEYLAAIYGDYMKYPPLSARVRGHMDNKYFWK